MNSTKNMQRGFAVSAAIGIIALLTLIGGGAYVAYEQRANVNADVNADERGNGWFRFGNDDETVETNASVEGRTNADLNADVNAGLNSTADVTTNASTTHRIDADLDANVDANLNL